MKKFLLYFACFMVPILLISYPLDCFLSREMKKLKYYAQDEFSVWNDLYEGVIDADIAIYGSSRAWLHINPKMFEERLHKSAYNFGIDGHNFLLQHLRHHLLLKYNQKPQHIILSLDMFTLEKRPDLFNPDQFLPFMLFDHDMKNYIEKYEGYTKYDYWIPLVRYYGKTYAIKNAVVNIVKPDTSQEGRYKGYKGKAAMWTTDLAIAIAQRGNYEVKIDQQTLTLFENFISACKKQGISLILIYSPEYIEGQKFVKNRDQIMTLYQEISLKHNLPFLDYSGDEMSFNREYFYNTNHLTIKGSELFTAKLINDLIANKLVTSPF